MAKKADLEALAAELVDSGSREHYSNPILYDYEYRRRRADVTFYRQLAKQRLGTSGTILELGAGSGRVTIPLARDGHEVLGIDQMPPMLARLHQRAEKLSRSVAKRIETECADLCTFSAPGTYGLAIAAFNVLEHLYTRVEFDACLRRVAARLAPGGAFAFDVQVPDLEWLIRDPTKRWARTRFTDPMTGRAMLYSTNHDYDPVTQICIIRLYYEPADGKGPSKIVKLTQRKYFPAELEALVAHAGFRVVARYGDFFWGELTGTVESQVLVCEPVAAPKPRRTSRTKR